MMGILGKVLRFWMFLAFGGFWIYFAQYNQDMVDIFFPPWIEKISLQSHYFLGGAFGAGAVFASLFFMSESIRKSWEIRKLKKNMPASASPVSATSPTAAPSSPS